MKKNELSKKYNNINPKAKISDTVDFYKNAVGIYIAGGVTIGDYCKIYPKVTIGKRHGSHIGTPKIGNYVTIYAGANILGPVTIGDNSIISAGATVLDDVPPNHVATSKKSRATMQPIDYSKIYPEMDKPMSKKDILMMVFGLVIMPVTILLDWMGLIKVIDEDDDRV